jgi:amino acid transporter
MNELSVSDGFKFGCGFFIAGFITWLVIVVTMVLIMLVFGATLGSLFQNMDFGQLLPLWAVV